MTVKEATPHFDFLPQDVQHLSGTSREQTAYLSLVLKTISTSLVFPVQLGKEIPHIQEWTAGAVEQISWLSDEDILFFAWLLLEEQVLEETLLKRLNLIRETNLKGENAQAYLSVFIAQFANKIQSLGYLLATNDSEVFTSYSLKKQPEQVVPTQFVLVLNSRHKNSTLEFLGHKIRLTNLQAELLWFLAEKEVSVDDIKHSLKEMNTNVKARGMVTVLRNTLGKLGLEKIIQYHTRFVEDDTQKKVRTVSLDPRFLVELRDEE